MQRNRRQFMNDVGNGMLIAGLGSALAGDLGITPAFADDGADELSFGKLEPLVDLMQEKPGPKLQPVLVEKLKNNETTLRELIAAAALANAETFGGEDYVGYHTEMALIPALQMAKEMPKDRRPLPVLKVLYRNADRIQASGLAGEKTLRPVQAAALEPGEKGGAGLRAVLRSGDMQRAEQVFAAHARESIEDAYNALLWSIEDGANVHRFVLAHRAYGLIDVVGEEYAHTLLRQCVRFCVDREQRRLQRNKPPSPIRSVTPRLLDQHKLVGRKLGTRKPDDAWIDEMARIVFERTGAEAMDAVAAALAEGISPEAVGEAISLAANQLVLRQDKLSNGSLRAHGATPGVHSSDAANAWRQMARNSDERNTVVGLMVAAYHTGGYEVYKQEDAYPHSEHREAITSTDAKKLLQAVEEAIRQNEQGHAAAAIQIYAEQGYAAKPAFDLMLRYAVSEDGRLHAEKYYQTVAEEFAAARPAFRWRHLIGLARVTASAYGYDADDRRGYRAPGYEDACGLLGVDA